MRAARGSGRLFVFFILTFLALAGCASKPEIVREMTSVPPEGGLETAEPGMQEQDGVKVRVQYLNQIELAKIAEENNPYLEGDTPLLTTFRVHIENKRKSRISFRIEDAVLLDGLGNQYSALTYESFKNLYPSTIYQKYEYSFIFDRYYMDTSVSDDYYKRKKAAKTLFKGGKIFPGVTVEGIIPFDRISERAKNITLILTDIKLYREETPEKENQSGETVEKVLEFKYAFTQKIKRTKD